MNRREALRQTALAAGAATLWASLPARTWAALAVPTAWSATDEALLTLIGDTIIPATATSPGAGSVAIGRFIITQATECYPPQSIDTLRRALREIDAASHQRFNQSFPALAVAEREQVLTAYEAVPQSGAHPFRLIKELTLLGPDSRRGEVTKLESVQEIDGQHVFSGVEHGRVISVIITKDGRMTLSISSDGVVWSVFGHALRDEDSK